MLDNWKEQSLQAIEEELPRLLERELRPFRAGQQERLFPLHHHAEVVSLLHPVEHETRPDRGAVHVMMVVAGILADSTTDAPKTLYRKLKRYGLDTG